MSARLLRCLLFAAVTVFTIPVHADWLCDFFKSIPQDTKRRNCWPQPFTCPDRLATRAPFAIEVANGWQRQNLLGDRYFEPITGELTEAGRLKVRWITFDAPSQHRVIYVRTAETAEDTTTRMNTVHAYVAKIRPQGELPSILETSISDEGRPADNAEIVIQNYKKYLNSSGMILPPFPGGFPNSGSSSSSGGGMSQ